MEPRHIADAATAPGSGRRRTLRRRLLRKPQLERARRSALLPHGAPPGLLRHVCPVRDAATQTDENKHPAASDARLPAPRAPEGDWVCAAPDDLLEGPAGPAADGHCPRADPVAQPDGLRVGGDGPRAIPAARRVGADGRCMDGDCPRADPHAPRADPAGESAGGYGSRAEPDDLRVGPRVDMATSRSNASLLDPDFCRAAADGASPDREPPLALPRKDAEKKEVPIKRELDGGADADDRLVLLQLRRLGRQRWTQGQALMAACCEAHPDAHRGVEETMNRAFAALARWRARGVVEIEAENSEFRWRLTAKAVT
mmetsp:Transcript_8462/g.26317  ORF Transcript_8462/g.26317 Transcript_8462/m.26317 type:complete len:314 (-) Transcript_8462:231-1172(-)